MERKWLKEALFAGMTANAFKLGTVLSLGWFWMRPAGCHTVYRGQDGVMDYEDVQAVMNVGQAQGSIEAQNLPAGTIWHYIRRQVSDCGLESPDSPACIVRIDSDGNMLGNTPNPPVSLTATGLADGKVKLRWRYTKNAEEIAPTGFHIYIDSGSGFDFTSPDADILYHHGGPKAGEFDWTSEALTHGQIYRFCVRSYRLMTAIWMSPTGYNDPDSKWISEEWAYDDDVETSALCQNDNYFLELLCEPILCSKVRLYQFDFDTIDLDVWNADTVTWVNVYDGAIVDYEWVEKAIPGGAININKARIRGTFSPGYAALNEFDFWGSLINESQNTDFVSIAADSMGPDAITGLLVNVEEI